MSISGIYSLTNEVINSTESKISTSYVKIDLKEYRDGEEYTLDNEVVMPGEDISLNPRVNNLGIECYLRAKITYSIDGKEYDEFEYIKGNYNSWNKKDGYYYYGSTLKENEEVDLFDTIHIPNLSKEYEGKKIVVHIIVEAIQAKNFDEDWDNVEIIEAVDRSYSIDSNGGSEVVFENGAQKYLDIGDGFFDNLGDLLPGDSISDKVVIENNSKGRFKYYLSINTDSLTNEEKDLLNNINITVKNRDGTVLNDGAVLSINNLLLGTYDYEESDEITFEISIPKELDNKYSKLMTKIVWVFSLAEEERPVNPNTWDLKFDLSIIVFLASAIGLVIVMIIGRKENDNIENRKKEGN